MAGESITTYSTTRWWSWWEVLKQLQRLFTHVRPFLEALDSSPAVRRHLLDVIEDEDKFRQLKLELAVVIDAGEPFVTRTYLLEGDGELATLAYDLLQKVSTACGLEDYPLLEAVANDLADGNDALKRQMTTMAKQCVRPAIAYFREKFSHIDSPLQWAVQLFKALRMFCPFKVASLNLVPNRIDDLLRLPALDHDETIQQLKTELPIYLVAAREAGPADGETQLQWWKKQTHLPTWQLAQKPCSRCCRLQHRPRESSHCWRHTPTIFKPTPWRIIWRRHWCCNSTVAIPQHDRQWEWATYMVHEVIRPCSGFPLARREFLYCIQISVSPFFNIFIGV